MGLNQQLTWDKMRELEILSEIRTYRNVIKECLCKLFLDWLNIFLKQICSEKSDSTVYVETNSTFKVENKIPIAMGKQTTHGIY